MPKSKKPAKRAAKAPAATAAPTSGSLQPKAVQRPGADAHRALTQKVKPMPLPGKSRGR